MMRVSLPAKLLVAAFLCLLVFLLALPSFPSEREQQFKWRRDRFIALWHRLREADKAGVVMDGPTALRMVRAETLSDCVRVEIEEGTMLFVYSGLDDRFGTMDDYVMRYTLTSVSYPTRRDDYSSQAKSR